MLVHGRSPQRLNEFVLADFREGRIRLAKHVWVCALDLPLPNGVRSERKPESERQSGDLRNGTSFRKQLPSGGVSAGTYHAQLRRLAPESI